ncbi:MAG: hypothetical protein LC799_24750 [Actinobacteria bacterium]|nr:hypothetical protein [Actinomycetota bacterium]
MVAGSGRRDAIALVGALVVYAAYLAAAALTVSLLAFLVPWWWRGRRATALPATEAQVTEAADQLAQRMIETWRQEAKDRRISTPAPVRVQWQWGPHEVAPPPRQVTTAPVAGTGPPPCPSRTLMSRILIGWAYCWRPGS